MNFLAYEWSVFEHNVNCKWAYFDPLLNIEEGLNPVWAPYLALASQFLQFTVNLHDLFGLYLVCFGACYELWVRLFCVPLQHCRRDQPCWGSPCYTCHYTPLWPPFLHAFLSLSSFCFRPSSELERVIFWSSWHISLRVFAGLMNVWGTSCYSLMYPSSCMTFLACFHTDLGDVIYCKCSYF